MQGKGLWDSGPVDQASVDAMKTWNLHAVRIPLNEQCWLGPHGSDGRSSVHLPRRGKGDETATAARLRLEAR